MSAATLRLDGTAVASPPGSTIEIVDHWGFQLPLGAAPTQTALSLATERVDGAHRGVARQVPVEADGTWGIDLAVDRSTTSVHILAVTQKIPGVRVSTRYVAVQVLAPVVLRRAPATENLMSTPVSTLNTQGSQQNQNQNQIPTPPTAPTNVVAVSAPSAAVVSWSPVFSQSSPVTSYVVSVVDGSVPGCTVLITPGAQGGQQPSCTVSGLRNGTAYQFTVVARNTAGDSPSSSASASVTPAGVPAAPALVRATARSGSAKVTWSSKANNGAAITSFTVSSVEDPNARCTSS
jgi:hypothetical protein